MGTISSTNRCQSLFYDREVSYSKDKPKRDPFQRVRLLMTGLRGAGKSSIMQKMNLGEAKAVSHSMGKFVIDQSVYDERVTLTVFDLGNDVTLKDREAVRTYFEVTEELPEEVRVRMYNDKVVEVWNMDGELIEFHETEEESKASKKDDGDKKEAESEEERQARLDKESQERISNFTIKYEERKFSRVVSTAGIIWVLDATDKIAAYDGKEQSLSSRVELQQLLQEPKLANVPLLVLANKYDLPKPMSIEEIEFRLGLEDVVDRKFKIQLCNTVIDDDDSYQDGDGIFEGLDWLVDTIQGKAHEPKKGKVLSQRACVAYK